MNPLPPQNGSTSSVPPPPATSFLSSQVPYDMRSQVPSILTNTHPQSNDTTHPMNANTPAPPAPIDPSSASSMVMEQNRNTKAYQIKEGLTPDQYTDYLHGISEDLFDFVSNDLLNTIHYFLSLVSCPLQTPLRCSPHHLAHADQFRQYLEEQLGLISNELNNFKTVISKIVESNVIDTSLPDLGVLETQLQTYRNQPENSLWINYILQAMREIELQCTQMWTQRSQQQLEIQQTFEEGIRLICSHVMKLYTSLCPDLQQYLESRKLIEQQLHQKHQMVKAAEIEVRQRFYKTVEQVANQQITVLRDILNIYKIVLEEHNPYVENEADGDDHPYSHNAPTLPLVATTTTPRLSRNEYDQQYQKYQSVEKTLNIWSKLLSSYSEMNLPYPILPSQLHELNAWIVLCQRFFVQLLEKLAPTIATPLRPDPPLHQHYHSAALQENHPRSNSAASRSVSFAVEDDDENDNDVSRSGSRHSLSHSEIESDYDSTNSSRADDEEQSEDSTNSRETQHRQQLIHPRLDKQKTEPTPIASKVLGLVDIAPEVHNFYQNTKVHALQRLAQQEAYHQDLLNRYNRMQAEMVNLNQDLTSGLKEAELLQIFHEYSQTAQDAQEVLDLQAQASAFHAKQYEMERMSQWMAEQQQHLNTLIEQVKPKISTQKSLVQSLNRVLYSLQAASQQNEADWKALAAEEVNLCLFWKTYENNYQTEYLSYRAQTRALLETQLNTARTELCQCLQRSFRNLLGRYAQQLNLLQEAVGQHMSAITNARVLVDKYHRCLAAKEISDVSNEVDQLSQTMDTLIRRKEQYDWQSGMLSMQSSLSLFADAMGIMVEKLFQDPTVVQYLQTADHICCQENNVGSAPLPRGIGPDHPLFSRVGSANGLTFVQIIEYPERYNVSNLLAGSRHARKDVEMFVITSKGLREERMNVAKQRTVAEMMKEFNHQVDQLRR